MRKEKLKIEIENYLRQFTRLCFHEKDTPQGKEKAIKIITKYIYDTALECLVSKHK